jgi:hypothetical protein
MISDSLAGIRGICGDIFHPLIFVNPTFTRAPGLKTSPQIPYIPAPDIAAAGEWHKPPTPG